MAMRNLLRTFGVVWYGNGASWITMTSARLGSPQGRGAQLLGSVRRARESSSHGQQLLPEEPRTSQQRWQETRANVVLRHAEGNYLSEFESVARPQMRATEARPG